ncbi:MAG: recombinase family protein [Clostridia bacterium]|nr:recombinase family protein [Clostridia bacterium]
MTTNRIKNENNIKLKEENKMLKLDLYTSKFFGRVCYGFGRDENGFVYIKEDEANVVRMIYDMAIHGNSLQKIQAELLNRGIKSPSGKDKWTRDVIDKTINNEKYLTYIISLESFVDASIEKESRCRYVRS